MVSSGSMNAAVTSPPVEVAETPAGIAPLPPLPPLAAPAGAAGLAVEAVALQEALHRHRAEHHALGGKRVVQPVHGEIRPRLQDAEDPLPLRLDPRGRAAALPVEAHMAALAKALQPLAEGAPRQAEPPRRRAYAHALMQHGGYRRSAQVLAGVGVPRRRRGAEPLPPVVQAMAFISIFS